MDAPITEKQPSALGRVAAAINGGAHMIDVDDVKAAINEWGAHLKFENKMLKLDLAVSNARVLQLENQQESSLAAYREQCEAVMELNIRIKDLETQLFHYRVNAGGSEVLLDGTIKIRDRLVDYFRHVEGVVPFAKTAETRESGTAIVDGMNWLILETGKSRLAVQAVKAQRNQLEAELAEARLALDASQGQVKPPHDDFLEAYING